jgi:hypothetical protein
MVAGEMIVVRVELNQAGEMRCYYGDESLDPRGTGLVQIGKLPAAGPALLPGGNLDTTAYYHPVVFLIDPSTSDPLWSVDYFWATGSRDWTV